MLVDARDLVKDYPRTRALNRVSLQVRPGEIFGLFGPNGAGKTTCLRVLTGLTRPDGGWAQVVGVDALEHPNLVRRNVAVLFDIPHLYEGMTFRQYLEFFGRLGGTPHGEIAKRVGYVLHVLDQPHLADARIGKLSMGERQRVEIGRVLMGAAQVLFLDEPFSNVDVDMRIRLKGYLRDWLADGRSIVYTSHNLLESEHLVDRFAFLNQGSIVAVGTAHDLKERLLLPVFYVEVSDVARALAALAPLRAHALRQVAPNALEVAVVDRQEVPRVARLLVEAGVDILEMKGVGTMEHVYQRLVHGPPPPPGVGG